ncbi:MAG: succinate dehydrogenase / fumarate reductase, cytochrome b subunit, partial [Actinomycetota bacterium]|nr:succinate dehydrogenase / fumarate reductase, cytochrome b subunit [Actinomycetota bacterium]
MATTATPPTKTANKPPVGPARPIRKLVPNAPPFVRFYRSSVGKKWVMAVTGVMLMGFIVFHLIGNLKLYLSKEELNLYGEALRDIPGHLLPRTFLLWVFRAGLITAFVLHIHAAYGLTLTNRKARPQQYQSKRDYVAADFASRTMRWTGIIVLLYLVFHLMDLTWGTANSEWVRGDPYNNLVYSLQRPVVALAYAVANIALAFHLYHGAWSMFQSMGINNPRINKLRRSFATGFAGLILIGNLSFPVLIQLHVVDLQCPHTEPTTA